VLHDVDEGRLKVISRFAGQMKEATNARLEIEPTIDRGEPLEGAARAMKLKPLWLSIFTSYRVREEKSG
jgi:alpha-galactosidase/6-phospho-beta-glucosidase family protein